MMIVGCTIHSTAERSDTEYIINAPIDVVWEKTLQALSQEKVTLKTVKKPDYFISGWNWWGDEISVSSRSLDVHIGRLRTKIESDPQQPTLLTTVAGVGYRLEAP